MNETAERQMKQSLVIAHDALDLCKDSGVDKIIAASAMFEVGLATIAEAGGSAILERVLTKALSRVVDRTKEQ